MQTPLKIEKTQLRGLKSENKKKKIGASQDGDKIYFGGFTTLKKDHNAKLRRISTKTAYS